MNTLDIVARPVAAVDDAEVIAARLRLRLAERDLDGAARTLAALESKTRAAAAILGSRRALLERA